MASKSVTTTTYECDFKCGATKEITDVRTELNHAHVPYEWEKVYRVPTGYMTTDSDKVKIPYVLCPKCYRLFEIAAMGYTTPMGWRFRAYVESFLQAEKALETDPPNLLVNFDSSDIEGSPRHPGVPPYGAGGGGGSTSASGGGFPGSSSNGCPIPGCNLPNPHGHGGGGGSIGGTI